jgi:hypothetical protein
MGECTRPSTRVKPQPDAWGLPGQELSRSVGHLSLGQQEIGAWRYGSVGTDVTGYGTERGGLGMSDYRLACEFRIEGMRPLSV